MAFNWGDILRQLEAVSSGYISEPRPGGTGNGIINPIADSIRRRLSSSNNNNNSMPGIFGLAVDTAKNPKDSLENIFGNVFNAGILSPYIRTTTGAQIPGHGTIDPSAQKLPPLNQTPNVSNQPSLTDILLQAALGGGPSIDTSQIQKQAQEAAGLQFDPQIAALQGQIAATQQRANTNKQQLGDMFNSLSTSLKGEIPGINQNFAQGSSDISDQYKQLQSQIAGQYADANAQEQDLMKRLNLQAAAPNIVAQQASDQAFTQNQNATSQQDTLDALKLLQQGAVDFTNEGSQIAKTEGTQRQADLMNQLEQFMQQATGQVNSIEAQKSSAAANIFNQLLGQTQQQASQEQQNRFSNLLDIAKLEQQQQNQTPNYSQGPLAASQFLGENDPANASKLNSFLLSVLQLPQFTTGRSNSTFGGESVPLTPEAAASIAQQTAQQAGMSPTDQRNIYLAMLAYYGRLYK